MPRGRRYEYRFENATNGTYAVELRFAELHRTRPNTRLFDVIVEATRWFRTRNRWCGR
ncbi:malectin domain-containing carbohydrate-binding protein [Actinophytocola sp.]|uniref:malectin domain-containing carbohydrate-binding protein n=1 Tax=Actinophytocola sp. TaxID=1872138 RepID=UPI0039C8A665